MGRRAASRRPPPLPRIYSPRFACLTPGARHVGDFTRWKEHDSYRKAFDRLLKDLEAES